MEVPCDSHVSPIIGNGFETVLKRRRSGTEAKAERRHSEGSTQATQALNCDAHFYIKKNRIFTLLVNSSPVAL